MKESKDYLEQLGYGLLSNKEEVEDMSEIKVRCTICLMQYGGAYKTTKVKLKQIANVTYLVCSKHEWVEAHHLRKFKHDENGRQKC